MPKTLINELADASPNRRSFLKTIGAAAAGVTALSAAAVVPAKADTGKEIEILKFALNLEYLESEFYTYALYGKGIESFGIGVSGEANGSNPPQGGTTTGGVQVDFGFLPHAKEISEQIGSDERAHVKLLRTALGSQAIAKPNINLNALKLDLQLYPNYLRQARIFEDIGISAYAGSADMLTTPFVLRTAARILATEGEHSSTLRTQIALLGITTMKLDGADILPPPSGSPITPLSVNPDNGLVAIRAPEEVLYLAFGMQADVTSGGFFPTGVNGSITRSSGPATAANLKT